MVVVAAVLGEVAVVVVVEVVVIVIVVVIVTPIGIYNLHKIVYIVKYTF